MGRRTVKITEKTEFVIFKMGIRIKKARLRRNIMAEKLAEQVGISKGTLSAIEQGETTVSIGAYAAVLTVLELDNDLGLVALDEAEKKQFREQHLQRRERATRKKGEKQ